MRVQYGLVDADRVATLRVLLAASGWLERTAQFARRLRTSTRSPGGLLLVGTPAEDPWHLAAHLDEESRLAGIPELSPTLVRWSPPPDAPEHLRVGLARLAAAQRGETLFVVAPAAAPVPLLERVSDARKIGATILALDRGDHELDSLAHETLVVPGAAADAGNVVADRAGRPGPGKPSVSVRQMAAQPEADWPAGLLSFDAVQHLISAAAGDRDLAIGGQASSRRSASRGMRGLRDKVARLLDTVTGPTA